MPHELDQFQMRAPSVQGKLRPNQSYAKYLAEYLANLHVSDFLFANTAYIELRLHHHSPAKCILRKDLIEMDDAQSGDRDVRCVLDRSTYSSLPCWACSASRLKLYRTYTTVTVLQNASCSRMSLRREMLAPGMDAEYASRAAHLTARCRVGRAVHPLRSYRACSWLS